MPKIIDCFTYNGEKDILDIHLNVLNDYVDEFIICEAPLTFSGKSKPLYFEEHKNDFKKFLPKIKYFIINENDPELWEMARNSPNTQGAEHWKREFVQKESIKKAFSHLNDSDIVFIGDVDEIWNPKICINQKAFISVPNDAAWKLPLDVYTYYLNNLSSENFIGTLVSNYETIKNNVLNHLRSCRTTTLAGKWGWHFTSMKDEIKRKLEDSYTKETYANDWVMNNLEENIKNSKDFLGRNFEYKIDESEWPEYLKKNKEKYKHLCK